MTDDELDYAISETEETLRELKAERTARRQADWAPNPYRVGDIVTTKLSYINSTVTRVLPRSVIAHPFGRIPVERVILVERPQASDS